MTRRGLFGLLAPQIGTQELPQQPRDVFTTPANYYLLSALPTSSPLVFVNGMLMEEGKDYICVYRTLAFTGQHVGEMDQVTVQVLYRSNS